MSILVAYKSHACDNALILGLKAKIINYLKEHGTATLGQLTNKLSTPRSAVWRAVDDLRVTGIVNVKKSPKGSGKGFYYTVYLAEASQ